MNNVIQFKRPDLKEQRKAQSKGKTLCLNGFHKWKVWQKKQFDVKSGKLITVYKCDRCGKTKTQLLGKD